MPDEITQLLDRMRNGEVGARDRLVEQVQPELRRLAAAKLRMERVDHTLQATALVNEAYLKLLTQQDRKWQSRAHFFAVAARVMRQILVDHARKRTAVKRGAAAQRVELKDTALLTDDGLDEVLAVDEALRRLEVADTRQARVVELRYFAGSTVEEVAEALSLSASTVKRESAMALAWLHRELSGDTLNASDRV